MVTCLHIACIQVEMLNSAQGEDQQHDIYINQEANQSLRDGVKTTAARTFGVNEINEDSDGVEVEAPLCGMLNYPDPEVYKKADSHEMSHFRMVTDLKISLLVKFHFVVLHLLGFEIDQLLKAGHDTVGLEKRVLIKVWGILNQRVLVRVGGAVDLFSAAVLPAGHVEKVVLA